MKTLGTEISRIQQLNGDFVVTYQAECLGKLVRWCVIEEPIKIYMINGFTGIWIYFN